RPAARACDSGALSSGRPITVCFERCNDASNQAGRVGCAADACGVDSSGDAALGEHVGARFDEDSLPLAEVVPHSAGKVPGDECVGAPEGIDPACLQICEVKQEKGG